jgi:hypothetical protein
MERCAPPVVAALAVVVDAVVGAVVGVVQGSSAGSAELSADEARELLLAVFAQTGRLQVAGARLSTVVDDEGLWALEGARSFGHWLAAATGMPYVKARSVVACGRALRDHLPATLAAGLVGEVSLEQVQTMASVAATSEARCAALAAPAADCGEEFLLAHAQTEGAEGFRRLARRWAAAADPACDERGYKEACDREFLALSPTLGGFHLAGFLTTEHGAVVGTALDAVMTPPAAGDARTTQQRRAQALADVSRLVLDHGLVGTGAAVRPHLSVVVDFATLRRAIQAPRAADVRVEQARHRPASDEGHGAGSDEGDGVRADQSRGASRELAGQQRGEEDELVEVPFDSAFRAPAEPGCLFRLAPVADVERFAVGEILGAGPIPASVLARLACDSEVSRLVFGPDSQVINAGRGERSFAGPRRKAVIARDGHCRYPGCTAPPALGEIHHVDEWVRDHGETDINMGILLCWYHHDLIHRLHIQIRPSPGGGWLFLTRHGTPVTTAA